MKIRKRTDANKSKKTNNETVNRKEEKRKRRIKRKSKAKAKPQPKKKDEPIIKFTEEDDIIIEEFDD